MGTPQANPEGDETRSVLPAVKEFKGSMLLIQGTLDDNVHPQNAIQLLAALQKAGHSPEMVLLPGSDHSPGALHHVWTYRKAMWDFLQKNR